MYIFSSSYEFSILLCNSPTTKKAEEAQRKGIPIEKCIKDDQLREGLAVWPLLLYLAAQEQCELGHDPSVLLLVSMDYRYSNPEIFSVVTA